MSKQSFKEKVKTAVQEVAFEELKLECCSKEKTKDLTYSEFQIQEYMTSLYPNHSRIIFKCRSKTLSIKEHMQYKYRNQNHCRWCGISNETLEHIVNCGTNGCHIENVDEIIHGNDLHLMKEVAIRIEDFLEKVDI